MRFVLLKVREKSMRNILSITKAIAFSILSKNPAFLFIWGRGAVGIGINYTKTYNEQTVNNVSWIKEEPLKDKHSKAECQNQLENIY